MLYSNNLPYISVVKLNVHKTQFDFNSKNGRVQVENERQEVGVR